MSNPATILLVDDEEAVQKLLTFPLERDGYRVVQARDGDEALRQFDEHSVDLVVLDLMLPKLDGLEVCKRIRAVSHVPIIMLTARDDEVDKVLGLELGADDYITKPFSIREFRSRVRAALRRAAAPKLGDDELEPISIDGLVVDPGRRTVTVNGEPVDLTYVEFELLSTLACATRPRVQPAGAARRALGGLRVPRSADDRRPRPPPAREARADAERAAVHPHRARRRLPLPGHVNPLRSVGARLSLALLLVVAMALGLVYLAVAPSLESRLVDSRLNDLERIAPALAQQILAQTTRSIRTSSRARATTTNARVVLLTPLSRGSRTWTLGVRRGLAGQLRPTSATIRSRSPTVARPHRHAASTVSRSGERFAEVTVPVGRDGTVLLLSASLDRALGDVSVVKRRLLIAGGVALALALVVGYAGSWVFARRIRRLERAAERIADGMFDEPVTDLGNDEVGELARAFERMRRRLAQLDHARREFIANASHELRTPVFSLGGFLELLDSEELDEETRREFLTTMREQVQRLEKLATELLDLSRLDAGHIDLDRDVVPLDEVAHTAAAEFTAVALQSGHELEVDAPQPRRRDRGRAAHAPDRAHPHRERARPHARGDARPYRHGRGRTETRG